MDIDNVNGYAVMLAVYKPKQSIKTICKHWNIAMRFLQYIKTRNIGLLLYDAGAVSRFSLKKVICFNRITASLAFFDFEEVMTVESLWVRFCKNMTNCRKFTWDDLINIPDTFKRKLFELCCISLSEYQQNYLPCYVPRYDYAHIKTAKSDYNFSRYAHSRKYDINKQVEMLKKADTGPEITQRQPAPLSEKFSAVWRDFCKNELAEKEEN